MELRVEVLCNGSYIYYDIIPVNLVDNYNPGKNYVERNLSTKI